jgi:polyisoprenoid-binding protein YceI
VGLGDLGQCPSDLPALVGVEQAGEVLLDAGQVDRRGLAQRAVSLEVDHLGHAADPWGNDRAVFSAHTTIDRGDFGLTWNIVLEAGGLLVSDEIRIEIEIETVRQQA